MSFQSINRILPSAIEQAGLKRQMDAVRVLEVARELLCRLWGEERASFVQWVSFSEGGLKIESRSAPAVQELKLMETRFMNDLNRQLGSRVVRSLSIRLS